MLIDDKTSRGSFDPCILNEFLKKVSRFPYPLSLSLFIHEKERQLKQVEDLSVEFFTTLCRIPEVDYLA